MSATRPPSPRGSGKKSDAVVPAGMEMAYDQFHGPHREATSQRDDRAQAARRALNAPVRARQEARRR